MADDPLAAILAQNAARRAGEFEDTPSPTEASRPPALRGTEAEAGAPTAAEPAAPPASASSSSLLDRVGRVVSGAGDILTGAVVGGARGIPRAVGGIFDFGDDVARAGTEAVWDRFLAEPTRAWAEDLHENDPDAFYRIANFLNDNPIMGAANWIRGAEPGERSTYAERLGMDEALGEVGNPLANRAFAGIASIVAPYARLSSVSRGAAVTAPASVLGRYGSAIQSNNLAVRLGAQNLGIAATSAVVLNPQEERIANLVQQLGIDNDFINWLAHDDDEGVWEGRIKNGIEDLGIGLAADAIFHTLRAARHFSRGEDTAGQAAQQEAQRASIATVRQRSEEAARTVSAQPGTPPRQAREGAAAEGVASPRPERPSRAAPPRPPQERLADIGMDPEDTRRLAQEILERRARTGSPDIRRATDPELTSQVGEYRLGTLGARGTSVPQTLRAVLETMPEAATRAPRSDQELMQSAKAVADAMGEDPTTILEAANVIAGRYADADLAMAALQTQWARAGRELDSLLDIDFRQATPQQLEQAAIGINNVMRLSEFVGTVKTSLGRGLRVRQLRSADEYINDVRTGREGDAVTRRAADPDTPPPLPTTPDEIARWMDLWRVTRDDPYSRAALTSNLSTIRGGVSALRQSLANAFTGSVLSGLPTFGITFTGPAIISALRTIEKTSGAMLASMNPALSAQQRRELIATAAGAPAAYIQSFGDLAQSLTFGLRAMKENRQILQGTGHIDTRNTYGNISASARMAEKERGFAIANEWAYPLANLLNVIPRQVARLNQGIDEMARRQAYLGEVRATAYVRAIEEGVPARELQDYVRKAVADATDEAGRATDQALLREAERSTLTSRVGEEGTSVRSLSDAFLGLRNQVPELRYVVPIFNVPMNAMGELYRRLPVANMAVRRTREDLLGKNGSMRQAEAYGRVMLGGAALGAGMIMAGVGQITGGGPRDPRARREWLKTHQPYSIRVGDNWVDYSRYDIIGPLLGIPATIFDSSVHRRPLEPQEQVLGGVGALAEYFRDRAALQGVVDILNFGSRSQDQSDARAMENLLADTAARIMIPNIVTQLGRNVGDPINRQPRGFAERIQNMVPGMSQELDPLMNVLGEPVNRPKDTLAENIFPFTMTPASNWEENPVIDELHRIYVSTGYVAGVVDTSALGGAEAYDMRVPGGYYLPNEIAYVRGQIRLDGLTLRQRLEELINSPEYNAAEDGPGTGVELVSGEENRGSMISRVFTEYTRAARGEVARTHPEAARWMAAVRIRNRGGPELRNSRISDVASNANGLLDALGIDIQDFIEEVQDQ